MKTAELEGAALDAAVAKAAGLLFDRATDSVLVTDLATGDQATYEFVSVASSDGAARRFSPSTDWASGGALIEREKIAIVHEHGIWLSYVDGELSGPDGQLESLTAGQPGRGPTPLIAAMRAFVASRLGDDVELP